MRIWRSLPRHVIPLPQRAADASTSNYPAALGNPQAKAAALQPPHRPALTRDSAGSASPVRLDELNEISVPSRRGVRLIRAMLGSRFGMSSGRAQSFPIQPGPMKRPVLAPRLTGVHEPGRPSRLARGREAEGGPRPLAHHRTHGQDEGGDVSAAPLASDALVHRAREATPHGNPDE